MREGLVTFEHQDFPKWLAIGVCHGLLYDFGTEKVSQGISHIKEDKG